METVSLMVSGLYNDAPEITQKNTELTINQKKINTIESQVYYLWIII